MGIDPNHPALKMATKKGLKTTAGKTLAELLADREELAKGQPAADHVAAGATNRRVGEEAAATVALWCRAKGWLEPVTEYVFARPRRWRFDMAWVDVKVAVEFQGGLHTRGRHVRSAGFTADCEKFSEAAAMGWRLLIVTYPQLKSGQLFRWLDMIFQIKSVAVGASHARACGTS